MDGDGLVFVNGQKLARTGNPHAPAVYDVKSALHPGPNTVAVTLANWGEAAGLNKGAQLRLADSPGPPQWRRSVFNGLAQVIVQATGESGAIKLTAKSQAMVPVAISIDVVGKRRPTLP